MLPTHLALLPALQQKMLQLLNKAAEGSGVQGVVDSGTTLADGDKALSHQHVHVIGDGGRSQAQLLGEIQAVKFGGLENPKSLQAAFVAHGF